MQHVSSGRSCISAAITEMQMSLAKNGAQTHGVDLLMMTEWILLLVFGPEHAALIYFKAM